MILFYIRSGDEDRSDTYRDHRASHNTDDGSFIKHWTREKLDLSWFPASDEGEIWVEKWAWHQVVYLNRCEKTFAISFSTARPMILSDRCTVNSTTWRTSSSTWQYFTTWWTSVSMPWILGLTTNSATNREPFIYSVCIYRLYSGSFTVDSNRKWTRITLKMRKALTHFLTPAANLEQYFRTRKMEIESLCSSVKASEVLQIEQLVHSSVVSLWAEERGTTNPKNILTHPSPSLYALLSSYLRPDVDDVTKHRLVQYVFMDLTWIYGPAPISATFCNTWWLSRRHVR